MPTANLTEAHRLAQARLGAQSANRVRLAWPLLDPAALDATVARWLRVTVPIVQEEYNVSARLAANYLTTFRTLELGVGAPVVAPVLSLPDLRAVATSLLVTGPVSIKSGMKRGGDLASVVDIAEARSARAAMRHAMAGGRDTVTLTAQSDRRLIGYRRVTSAKACDFCSMLAGRGPVYGEESAQFQAHDGCFCAAEPVFR